jgi:hypothetical protein
MRPRLLHDGEVFGARCWNRGVGWGGAGQVARRGVARGGVARGGVAQGGAVWG